MRQEGPLSQRFARSLLNIPCVHIGPVTLDVHPLSRYQESLITTILRLRSEGWLDHHGAKYFNELGHLIPRGDVSLEVFVGVESDRLEG